MQIALFYSYCTRQHDCGITCYPIPSVHSLLWVSSQLVWKNGKEVNSQARWSRMEGRGKQDDFVCSLFISQLWQPKICYILKERNFTTKSSIFSITKIRCTHVGPSWYRHVQNSWPVKEQHIVNAVQFSFVLTGWINRFRAPWWWWFHQNTGTAWWASVKEGEVDLLYISLSKLSVNTDHKCARS